MELIVAIDKKTRGIGINGKLLARIPDDMRNFRRITLGKTVVMGRKTYDSIGKPLPDRTNIVLSRSSPAENIPDDAIIIGGGEIYTEFLPKCTTAYVTEIDFPQSVDADVFFPELDETWEEIARSERFVFEDLYYNFVTYQRRNLS